MTKQEVCASYVLSKEKGGKGNTTGADWRSACACGLKHHGVTAQELAEDIKPKFVKDIGSTYRKHLAKWFMKTHLGACPLGNPADPNPKATVYDDSGNSIRDQRAFYSGYRLIKAGAPAGSSGAQRPEVADAIVLEEATAQQRAEASARAQSGSRALALRPATPTTQAPAAAAPPAPVAAAPAGSSGAQRPEVADAIAREKATAQQRAAASARAQSGSRALALRPATPTTQAPAAAAAPAPVVVDPKLTVGDRRDDPHLQGIPLGVLLQEDWDDLGAGERKKWGNVWRNDEELLQLGLSKSPERLKYLRETDYNAYASKPDAVKKPRAQKSQLQPSRQSPRFAALNAADVAPEAAGPTAPDAADVVPDAAGPTAPDAADVAPDAAGPYVGLLSHTQRIAGNAFDRKMARVPGMRPSKIMLLPNPPPLPPPPPPAAVSARGNFNDGQRVTVVKLGDVNFAAVMNNKLYSFREGGFHEAHEFVHTAVVVGDFPLQFAFKATASVAGKPQGRTQYITNWPHKPEDSPHTVLVKGSKERLETLGRVASSEVTVSALRFVDGLFGDGGGWECDVESTACTDVTTITNKLVGMGFVVVDAHVKEADLTFKRNGAVLLSDCQQKQLLSAYAYARVFCIDDTVVKRYSELVIECYEALGYEMEWKRMTVERLPSNKGKTPQQQPRQTRTVYDPLPKPTWATAPLPDNVQKKLNEAYSAHLKRLNEEGPKSDAFEARLEGSEHKNPRMEAPFAFPNGERAIFTRHVDSISEREGPFQGYEGDTAEQPPAAPLCPQLKNMDEFLKYSTAAAAPPLWPPPSSRPPSYHDPLESDDDAELAKELEGTPAPDALPPRTPPPSTPLVDSLLPPAARRSPVEDAPGSGKRQRRSLSFDERS
mgnify:CR=1 FL=1